MCGRFTVTAKNTKQIADHFQVELEKALKTLPNQCGQRAVLKAIEKLPERVEGAAPAELEPA